MEEQAAAFNAPLFIGEFGAPAQGERAAAYIDEFYRQLDAGLISAAQWNFTPHWTPEKNDGWNREDFSIVDDKGQLRATYRVRPYPARIAGEAISFHADKDRIELEWRHNPASGETRLFAPLAKTFGGQLTIQTNENLKCNYDDEQRHIRCTTTQAGFQRVRLVPCTESSACLRAMLP
jgi:endoglycosylceramidase